ncbi:unnamed protein product [Lampetra planeri]
MSSRPQADPGVASAPSPPPPPAPLVPPLPTDVPGIAVATAVGAAGAAVEAAAVERGLSMLPRRDSRSPWPCGQAMAVVMEGEFKRPSSSSSPPPPSSRSLQMTLPPDVRATEREEVPDPPGKSGDVAAAGDDDDDAICHGGRPRPPGASVLPLLPTPAPSRADPEDAWAGELLGTRLAQLSVPGEIAGAGDADARGISERPSEFAAAAAAAVEVRAESPPPPRDGPVGAVV